MASRSSGVALLTSEQMLEMAGHAQEPVAAEDAELVGDAEALLQLAVPGSVMPNASREAGRKHGISMKRRSRM